MCAVTALLQNPFDRESLILIEPEVIAAMREYRQLSPQDQEAGGILIGYRRGMHLHIVESTKPMPSDERSRYEFNRVDPHHARYAEARWRASNSRLDFAGEWHTHAQRRPAPSALDQSEWKRVLALADRSLVFAIVGTEQDWVGVGRLRRIREARYPHPVHNARETETPTSSPNP